MFVYIHIHIYIYIHICDSEFNASSQSSDIQYYFFLPKNKQIKTVIYIYHIKNNFNIL